MSAYLCIGIQTHKDKSTPTVVTAAIFSEPAQSVTRVGDGVEWAELYRIEGHDFSDDKERVLEIARFAFPWVLPLLR